ncbi:MAG: hypothetical protein ACPG7F_22775 [Aggregatilineales bacterium]
MSTRFFTEEGGWIEAEDLRAGDTVVSLSGIPGNLFIPQTLVFSAIHPLFSMNHAHIPPKPGYFMPDSYTAR